MRPVMINRPTMAEGTFTSPDPAERTWLRFFYRNRRPTLIGRWNSRLFSWWARIGLAPRFLTALEVPDRVSGRSRTDARGGLDLSGQRYIVSMFRAISDWVLNLDASGGRAAGTFRCRRERRSRVSQQPQLSTLYIESSRVDSTPPRRVNRWV